MTSVDVGSGLADRLIDLSDEAFAQRYDCDRFTVSVLTSRFRFAIEHMSSLLARTAFSPIIRESTDFAATVNGPSALGYALAAVSETNPLFFGAMSDAVRVVVEEYSEDLHEGDVLVVNDPYRVGTHLNDVCFLRPVIHDGEILGFVTIRAHMLDMGGRAAGGYEIAKATSWEDGLYLPPMLIYRGGERVRSTFSLVFSNTRLGTIVLPDIESINEALELGARHLVESARRYGTAAYLGAIRYTCDVAEEAMADALTALPDGVYEGEDWLDNDGVNPDTSYVVRARVVKAGARAELDFTASSPATGTAVNCSWPSLKSAVVIALKYLLDPHTPFSSGALRNIDIVPGPDTIVNAHPPHCCQYYVDASLGAVYALFRALDPVLGDRAVPIDARFPAVYGATGTDEDGRPWVCRGAGNASGLTPWPGTASNDGDSGQTSLTMNGVDGGIEQAEIDYPVVWLRRDYLPDGGGPGRRRGGTAIVQDNYWTRAAHHRTSRMRIKASPVPSGVAGGGDGLHGGAWLWDVVPTGEGGAAFLPLTATGEFYASAIPLSGVLDPETNELDLQGQYRFGTEPHAAPSGALARFITNGAAGFGDPFEREPERVLVDVRDGYVSLQGAERDYGVRVVGDPELDPEGLVIDDEATAALRAAPRDGTRVAVPAEAAAPEAHDVVREPVDGSCAACGAEGLERYPVLSEGGWSIVTKCPSCLVSAERSRWRPLGWFEMTVG